MPFIAPAIAAALATIGISASIATINAMLIGLLINLITTGLTMLLRSKPDMPSMNRRSELQTSVRDPVKPRELVVGKYRKGGTIVFLESVNNESDLLLAIALAGHKVKAIDEIYFFDELAIDQKGVIQPKFKKYVQFEKFLGTDDQAASTILQNNSSKWTANHRLRGIAYIVVKLTFNRDVFNQIPNITAVVRGAEVYDPRDAQTRYTANAALAIAHYLNHPTYGLGAEYGTEIDNTMLIAAANECDEDVAIKAGKVLEFDGIDDEIVIADNDALDMTGSLSIEARIYPAATNAIMNIVRKDNDTQGYGLQLRPNGVLRFFVRGTSAVQIDSPTSTIVANTWQHVAGVWNSAAGTLTLLVNGVQVAQTTGVTGNPAANSAALKIGAKHSGSGAYKGRIQDVRVWNDPRSNTEVAAFDDKTLQGTEANLAGYWKLDEKKGDRAEDATETPNDGTISGATWVDDDSVLGTQKRYTADGIIFSDEMPRNIVEQLLSAMAGNTIFSGGLWCIRAGAFETPTVSLDEGDARGALRVQGRRSRRELFNAVRGTFVAPENDYQPSDFPIITNATFEEQDGGQRIVQDIELPFTTSSSAAQRLAWLHLLRNREQVSCTYPAKLSALRLRGGGFVDVSNTRLGWDSKDFEVVNWRLVQIEDDEGNPAIGVDLDLREIAAAVFDFNPATDEVPINPSPNTLLPSPFGKIAIVSEFVSRTGFTEIASVEGQGAWPGTIVGFVHNPLTGHLNVDDQVTAAGDNQDVFDEYVQQPVVSAYYESPEIDIEFDDLVRTFVEYRIAKGAGEDGSFNFSHKYDVKPDGGEYGGFRNLLSSSAAEGRYFKHRIEFDFSSGTGGMLQRFNAIIDKTRVVLVGSDVIIPVGGKSIDFSTRFHKVPSMGGNVKSSAARTLNFPAISKTGFSVIVFDNAGSDVGGTIGWQATGV